MPSFTRRTAAPSALVLPTGTIPSPFTSHPLFPMGVPSMDDLFGGGLPLGSTCAITSPDVHSAWGRLMARYFVAQGLASGQDVLVIGEQELGRDLVKGCPWLEQSSGDATPSKNGADGAASESEGEGELGVVGQGRGGQRIAWRYDAMGKFKTSTGRSSNLNLMKVIPQPIVSQLERDGSLTYLSPEDASNPGPSKPSLRILEQMQSVLDKKGKGKAIRVVVNELASEDWGNYTSADIHRFLHTLRAILRTRSAAGIITFPSHLISSPPRDWTSGHEAWLKSLSWAVDGCIEMRGFADNPLLGPHYAPLHGLLTLHSYPTSHALLPPTLRHSTLLGVSQSATNERGGGGAGENNLGFRVKRKGLVVETAHLGIEGGSGERRTAPADVGQALDSTGPGVHDHSHPHTHSTPHTEGIQHNTRSQIQAEGVDAPAPAASTAAKPKKAKKSVRIQFDDGSLDF